MPRAMIRRRILCVLAAIATNAAIVSIGGTATARASTDVAEPVRAGFASQSTDAPQGDDQSELSIARSEADRKRRRGDWRGARADLDEILRDDAADAETRALLARVKFDEGDLDGALADARRAQTDAAKSPPTIRRLAARISAEIDLARGEAKSALASLTAAGADAKSDPRDAWSVGRAELDLGDRKAAREAWDRGAQASLDRPWDELLAKARCERRLGFLERASATLVKALESSQAVEHSDEPDLLVELGSLYFEADGEIEHKESKGRSPAPLFEQALKLDPKHEGAQIALYELYRFNWVRQRHTVGELLDQLFTTHPKSIEALLSAASADIDDGQLVNARVRLAKLEELAPKRRDVRTLRATLKWIENDHAGSQAMLDELAQTDPSDARPSREVGRHLCELYRFAEAVPFLEKAVARDATDWEAWTEYGRALANAGREKDGLAALLKADETAAGRANAWRHNTRLVLQKLAKEYVAPEFGEFSFAWTPGPAPVFKAYWIDFYERERTELAARYGFTPTPTHIEIFDTWRDFSVRSTGFEGFPALGVCFGPVVTAVSPISELRGKFSWARTAWHEFSHVIHLGLSHNRCPRWITEGLATWEEENKNPSWTRNMRRELVDSIANDDLLRVREMNRAFRGPRILFGYYQCGLICRMWIQRYGFQSMVGLLEAFDRGDDLDRALSGVLHVTPEQVDREFEAFARELTKSIVIEPRWSPATVAHLRLSTDERPKNDAAKKKLADDLCSLAWGEWEGGQRVDAEQALRRLDALGVQSSRAQFLRAEMAAARGETELAQTCWKLGLSLGGDDFRVRMQLGQLAFAADHLDEAIEQFTRAEALFPGYPEKPFAAELGLAAVYEKQSKPDDVQAARARWLAWNDDYGFDFELAEWHAAAKRFEEASASFSRANETDPFRRKLHVEWAKVLEGLQHWSDAAREWRMALDVPAEFDPDQPEAPDAKARADYLGHGALCAAKEAKFDEAAKLAKEALDLDADNEAAKQALAIKP